MLYTKYSVEETKEKLKNCLTPERYFHSEGVMETAVKLAQRFNCDREKAMTAGLLHDCAKCLADVELLKYKYCLSECEKESRKTWHAPIGALIAEKDYGVSDKEILSAIRFHTIGRKNMSDFEKIIFIADKIEPKTREPEYREPIEKALNMRNRLDDAVFESFKITIKSLADRELPICFQTIEVYNSLLSDIK